MLYFFDKIFAGMSLLLDWIHWTGSRDAASKSRIFIGTSNMLAVALSLNILVLIVFITKPFGINPITDYFYYTFFLSVAPSFIFTYYRYDRNRRGEKILKKMRKRHTDKKLIVMALSYYILSFLLLIIQIL
jgi:hypothetical protein